MDTYRRFSGNRRKRFLYVWGRLTDKVDLADGQSIYLFDIANKIKEFDYIDDAIVLPVADQDRQKHVVAHIVWPDSFTESEKAEHLAEMNAALVQFLPEGLTLCAYAEHESMLPYSPTTLKKDKNKMAKQTTGFYQIVDGKLTQVEL